MNETANNSLDATEGRLRILHIEDLPHDAELVSLTLRRAGLAFICRQVDSEAAVREALVEFRPNIVLADYNLPGFDGMAALEIIRASDPILPFIFVSGMIGEDRAIAALKMGATDYVLKSNLSRLAPAVTRALSEAANEVARQQAEERLRSNERRLRDIIETSQDWIWELDAEGRFTFCSGAVRRILGYAPEELIGRRYTELLHPDDAWRSLVLLPSPAKTSAEGAEPAAISGVNARWLHKDGSHRWLERAAIVRQHADEIVGYRGNDRDITLRFQHEMHIARLHRIHSLLSSVNAIVAKASERDKMLQDICCLAIERGGYLSVEIGLPIEANGSALKPVAWKSALENQGRTVGLSFMNGVHGERSLVDEAITLLKPAVCNDLHAVQNIPICHHPVLLEAGIRAMAALPLLIDGKPLGVIVMAAGEAGTFTSDELTLLEDIATDIAFALQSFEKDMTILLLSQFDPLTRLARRELFCNRANHCIARGDDGEAPLAMLVIDISHLGSVKDSYGKEFGDQLLRAIAVRLKSRIGDPERLAYLGNGNFAVRISGDDALGVTLPLVCEGIRAIFNESFHVLGRDIKLQVRTGTATFPRDASGPEQLLQRAEAAMRRAREEEISAIDYSGSINREITERMQLTQKLHRAIELRQFLVHYQPQIDLRSGRICGAEALLRWNDPEQGLVAPEKFIPLLEHSGEIVAVGRWVLEQALKDRESLRAEGYGNLRFAVNISPLQLHQSEFVPELLSLMLEQGEERPLLEVEITESMLVHDVEGAIKKLLALRELGVRVSIDDFGTGYSSLALLSRLPIDTLKIDRSFVRAIAADPNAMTVVTTVLNLARSLRLDTVAEGIETEDQLRLLRLMNCDMGQGWLCGKPMPLEAFKAVLDAQRHGTGDR